MKTTFGELVMASVCAYLIVILVPIFIYDWWLKKKRKEDSKWFASYVEKNRFGSVMA